jgi:lipopolysaccharide assembly protein A
MERSRVSHSRDTATTVRVMSADVPDTKPSGRRARRLRVRHWLAIILIVLAAIFVVQNTVRHEIHLLWVTVEAATWLVLIVIFLVGVMTGALLGRRRRR